MVNDFNCFCREGMSFIADKVHSTSPGMSVVAVKSFAIAVKGLTGSVGFSFIGDGVAIILTGVARHDFSGVCRIKKEVQEMMKMVSEKTCVYYCITCETLDSMYVTCGRRL